MDRTIISSCPLCGGADLRAYGQCTDHLVSNETFQLAECTGCGLIMTQDQPVDLTPYYQSDDYLSHQIGNTSFLARVYRFARQFNLNWKLALVRSYQKTGNLLDYGCGTGEFLRRASEQNFSVTGIEPSAKAREIAAKVNSAGVYSSLDQIPSDQKFAVVTLWHVLEHLPQFTEVLKTLTSKLHKGGNILIAVPNPDASEVSHYQTIWAAYDVPRHLWHFRPRVMERLLRTSGLILQATQPMKLDAYYVSLLSEQYLHNGRTPFTWARAVFQGYKSNQRARQTGQYSSLVYIARA